MFNLCKTVKIYQTINNHHPRCPSPLRQLHELHFQENASTPPPNAPFDLAIKTIESQSISPRKTRTGISLSIKQRDPLSPSPRAHPRPPALTTSHQHDPLANTNSITSEFLSFKLKQTSHYDCDSPLIVESKITYTDSCPRIRFSAPQNARPSSMEQELTLLGDVVLKREVTRTTQESTRSSLPQIQAQNNPLKKSASFIRNNNPNQHEDYMKCSVENSLKNSISVKLSNSKAKRQEVSDSLLRLSYSNYSQVPERANKPQTYQSISQTCSLQLKKDQSCFLKSYVCEVQESIILGKPTTGKQLKIVRSNNDLLNNLSPLQFKPSLSNIIEREADSPVKRLKKRYGDNLLNPYDKQTLVSKSFASKSNSFASKCHKQQHNHIIDQSEIIQHQIQNKFIPLKGRGVNRQFFRMFLAVQDTTQLLVAIKELPINRIDSINQQLSIYREMDSHSLDIDICKLYQLYTHGNIYVLVKQPYEATLQEFIQRHATEYVMISWDFIIRNIEESLRKTLAAMQHKHMQLHRLISIDDIVYGLGEWKLHSPEMFAAPGAEQEPVSANQALEYLKDQIMACIRKRQHLN